MSRFNRILTIVLIAAIGAACTACSNDRLPDSGIVISEADFVNETSGFVCAAIPWSAAPADLTGGDSPRFRKTDQLDFQVNDWAPDPAILQSSRVGQFAPEPGDKGAETAVYLVNDPCPSMVRVLGRSFAASIQPVFEGEQLTSVNLTCTDYSAEDAEFLRSRLTELLGAPEAQGGLSQERWVWRSGETALVVVYYNAIMGSGANGREVKELAIHFLKLP